MKSALSIFINMIQFQSKNDKRYLYLFVKYCSITLITNWDFEVFFFFFTFNIIQYFQYPGGFSTVLLHHKFRVTLARTYLFFFLSLWLCIYAPKAEMNFTDANYISVVIDVIIVVVLAFIFSFSSKPVGQFQQKLMPIVLWRGEFKFVQPPSSRGYARGKRKYIDEL